jgi:DNA-binding NtrC family response regulator
MTLQPEGNILIVDDQENWRMALQHLLEGRHNAQAVSSYEQAEQAILASSFDVVVLDVRLVDEDVFNVSGLALLDKIKKHKPNTGVVILTGYPDSVRGEIVQQYGADAFIFKVPESGKFDLAGFRSLIQDLVMKYKSQ